MNHSGGGTNQSRPQAPRPKGNPNDPRLQRTTSNGLPQQHADTRSPRSPPHGTSNVVRPSQGKPGAPNQPRPPSSGSTLTNAEGQSRKRVASQSPVGDGTVKPLPKVARPSPLQINTTNGSRISSAADPKRLTTSNGASPTVTTPSNASPAGSRRGSVPTADLRGSTNDVQGSSARAAAADTASSIGSRRSSDLPDPRPVPHAQSGGSYSGASTPRVPVALMSSNLQSSAEAEQAHLVLLAMNNKTMDIGQSRLRLADLKAAVDKASREYQQMHPHFNDFPALRETMTNAKTNAQTRLQAERALFDRLTMEQSQAVQAAATTLASANSQTDAKKANLDPETLQAMIKDAVASELRTLGIKVDGLETTMRGLVSDAKAANEQAASALSKCDMLRVEVGAQKSEMQDQARTEFEAALKRIGAIEQGMDDLKSKQQSRDSEDSSQILTQVAALETEVQNLKELQAEGQDIMSSHIDSQLQDQSQNLTKWVQEHVTESQKQIQDAAENSASHSIKGCNDKIKFLHERLVGAASKEDLAKISDAIERLESRPAQSKGEDEALGISEFRPLLPPGPEVTAEDIPRVDRMESELVAIRAFIDQHEQRLNNMTTDEVVQQMSDQMSKMWPDAKSFQTAVNNINQRINLISSRCQTLATRIDGMDVGKSLQAEINDLKLKLELYEGAIETGRTTFAHMEKEIKAMKGVQLQLQSSLDHALQRDTDARNGNGGV